MTNERARDRDFNDGTNRFGVASLAFVTRRALDCEPTLRKKRVRVIRVESAATGMEAIWLETTVVVDHVRLSKEDTVRKQRCQLAQLNLEIKIWSSQLFCQSHDRLLLDPLPRPTALPPTPPSLIHHP